MKSYHLLEITISRRYLKYHLIFLIALCGLLSCVKDDQEQAIESLLGQWNITSTYYESGERVNLGIRTDTSFTQTNTDGFINFKSNSLVSYNYSINKENINNENIEWSLDHTRVKNGFTKSSVYFIMIDNDKFEIQFGDGTSDAHINATKGKLIYNSNLEEIGFYYSYQLSLEKET